MALDGLLYSIFCRVLYYLGDRYQQLNTVTTSVCGQHWLLFRVTYFSSASKTFFCFWQLTRGSGWIVLDFVQQKYERLRSRCHTEFLVSFYQQRGPKISHNFESHYTCTSIHVTFRGWRLGCQKLTFWSSKRPLSNWRLHTRCCRKWCDCECDMRVSGSIIRQWSWESAPGNAALLFHDLHSRR